MIFDFWKREFVMNNLLSDAKSKRISPLYFCFSVTFLNALIGLNLSIFWGLKYPLTVIDSTTTFSKSFIEIVNGIIVVIRCCGFFDLHSITFGFQFAECMLLVIKDVY